MNTKKYLIHICCSYLVLFFLVSIVIAAPIAPTGLCVNDSNCGNSPNSASVAAPAAVHVNNFNPGYYIKGGISYDKPMPDFVFKRIKNNPVFVGHKQGYTWRFLEPEEGVYDFSIIESDLARLKAMDKRLWITVVTKGRSYLPGTPSYMWNDSKYGCDPKYYSSYSSGVTGSGRIVCYWNENVQIRYAALLEALGKRFNHESHFEGLNLTETSQNTTNAKNANMGYTTEGFKQGFMKFALAAKKAFPDKTVLQMINFAPYDLPAFTAWAVENGIGLGGPDVLLMSEKSLLHRVAYAQYPKYHDVVPTGIDVQWRNYDKYNLDIGRANTSEELLLGAIEWLNPHYMFWEARDDDDGVRYFTDHAIPALNKHGPLPAAKAFYDSMQ